MYNHKGVYFRALVAFSTIESAAAYPSGQRHTTRTVSLVATAHHISETFKWSNLGITVGP